MTWNFPDWCISDEDMTDTYAKSWHEVAYAFYWKQHPAARKIQGSNLKRFLCREAVWGYSHPERESG